jgi:spore coat protein JB
MMEGMNQCELLQRIRELEFAAVDLNLYLDNHPSCQKALIDYNTITQDLIRLKKVYEAQFGPLTNYGCSLSQYPWQWVNEPWPWETGE